MKLFFFYFKLNHAYFLFPVPEWADHGYTGCMLDSLPSLTITYHPEDESVHLLHDCGLDGSRTVACKGTTVSFFSLSFFLYLFIFFLPFVVFLPSFFFFSIFFLLFTYFCISFSLPFFLFFFLSFIYFLLYFFIPFLGISIGKEQNR